MIKPKMGTVRNFEFESFITHESLPDVDANICVGEVDGELFLEMKTLGSTDEMYDENDLQVIRLSKEAVEALITHWRLFTKATSI